MDCHPLLMLTAFPQRVIPAARGQVSSLVMVSPYLALNPLIAGVEYIRFSLNYYHIQYRLLNMLKP